ncbi:Phospholipase D beta 1-like protein [Drosera capensis]
MIMDGYGSPSNYPYNNPYGYPPPNQPYPPQNQPYPPPNHSYPPPNQPYPPPGLPPGSYPNLYGYHYPYPPSVYPSGPPPMPYPYGYPPPPAVATSSPQPTLQHLSSFQSNYHYQETGSQYPPPDNRPQLPERVSSFSSTHGQDSLMSHGDELLPKRENDGEYKPSRSSAYPPIESLIADMRLNDNNGSAAASPSAPSLDRLQNVRPPFTSYSGRFDRPGDLYGYPSSSSSSWDGSISDRMGTPSVSSFSHSSSFNHVQPGLQMVPFSPSKGSLKVLLLHGNLSIWVREAKNLPNMDMFHKTLGDVFAKLPGNVSNKLEGHMVNKITSDPYVSITISSAVIGRTYVISNEENPVWMQHFNVPVAHYAAEVHFLVKDSDVVGSQLMGVVAIPVEQIYGGTKVEGTYPILTAGGKPCKPGAALSISIQYTPIEELSFYHHGVGAGPEYVGVTGTYFPLRKGGTVTLYQDAHVPDGFLPHIWLDKGMSYVHGKCWQDIFDAIRQARRLIYITGWSVWHKVRLIRDGGPALGDCTLGELLRSKSQEGVRVLLLVWDDPTSRSILGYRTDGIMQTHDEETRRFFKHSSVQVLLCPRIAGKRHSWLKQREVETIYTHHQKNVIVDADAGNNTRKIIAFVGGLDLCDGRYDNPSHPIFRTLDTLHKDDYHNPCLAGNTMGCPREPWHDLHCKIDGPAAYDVLTNFQERWLKAAKPHGIKKLKMSYDDALLRIERMADIIGISDAPCLKEDDPDAWHVQIFRSIDSNSVKGFPKDPMEATNKNLVCGKNLLIDMSIHTAYVKAIRSAQHFIYIENQYFIGSSFNWSAHKDLGADNLIPMEIALKIADKIRAHQRFAAYIVIPMWPEGVPTSAPTQRILFWQNKTMQMMYETIHKALVEVGLEDAFVPQDFLNFFCLGNREAGDGNYTDIGSPHAPNTPQAHCQKSRRFMIYVHSKGMIVDDEYVIIGSANINQRSMEGTRDTEIAMGAYQPHYAWARKSTNPGGQIYGYRMSLWAEHLGVIEDVFHQPESLECVHRVRTLGEMNWKQFAAEEPTEMRAHLIKYPVDVDRRGKVKPLQGHETFPDVGGNICGSFMAIQENLTI